MSRRITLIILILCCTAALFAVDYNRSIFSKKEAIALKASDTHRIMAPNSSRSFRPYRRYRYYAKKKQWRKRGRYYKKYRSKLPPMLPSALYRITKTKAGYTLTIKQLPGMGSALLISEPIYDRRARRWKAYALRSIKQNKTNPTFYVARGRRLLGAPQGLYFLGNAQPKKTSTLGNAFQIFVPNNTIYGYWGKQIHSLKIRKGSILRVRFYYSKYADSRHSGRTYLIAIKQ